MGRVGFSKERLEMGEEAWAEKERIRKNNKSRKWNAKAKSNAVITCRQRKKIALIEYKGSICEKCGLKSHIPDLYDFHHMDPSTKEFALADRIGKNKSLEIQKKEVDKCILVCKNCHATIHWEQRQKDYQKGDVGLPRQTVNLDTQ